MKLICNWLVVLLLSTATIFMKGDRPMPRGFPDGDVSNYNYASRISDAAYVSQMLWGFTPIDSQGRIVYLDTFNNGLGGWAPTVSGAGAVAPTLHSGSFQGLIYSPPNAVLLQPGVTAGSLTGITREFYFGVSKRLGIEAAVRVSATSPNYYFRIAYRADNDHKYDAILRFDHATGTWKIELPSSVEQTIFTMNLTSSAYQQVKLVADWNTGRYVRALIGENLIDLSSYSMRVSAVPSDGIMSPTFRAVSYGAGTTDGYLGYALLTKDEP